jgi:catechol 2,3-dioxygenase-like lactoylglutathione lyase family enzyme
MATGTLEHVNLTVTDPARTADLLCRLFGWRIRWEGKAMSGGRTFHVGTDHGYLAVYGVPADRACPNRPDAQTVGRLNHVGVVVEDLDTVEQRVAAAGYTPFNHGDYEPGRRFYFLDGDGIEFEIVSYA